MKSVLLLVGILGLASGMGIQNASSNDVNYLYGNNIINNGDFAIGAGEYVFKKGFENMGTEGVTKNWGTYGADIKVSKMDASGNAALVMEQGAGFKDFFKFMPTEIIGGKTYDFAFDYKVDGTTDNIGIAFFSPSQNGRLPELNIFSPTDIENATVSGLTTEDLTDGWKRVSWQRLFAEGQTFDTLQFWGNVANGTIYIDNMSMKEVGTETELMLGGDFDGFLEYASAGLTETPDVNGAYGASSSLGDGYVEIQNNGKYGVTVLDLDENEYFLEVNVDEIAEDGKLSYNLVLNDESKTVANSGDIAIADGYGSAVFEGIDNAYSVELAYTGTTPIKVSSFTVKARYVSTYDPDKDYYESANLVVNGDFEAFEVGTVFSESQLEGAWGSVSSYDNPARIVEGLDGHAAAIGKHDESDSKPFSSMFLMTPDTLQVGDILRVKYDFKLVMNDAWDSYLVINSSFVGGANVDYYQVNLAKYLGLGSLETTSGSEKAPAAVHFETLSDGWVRVHFDFEVTNDIIQWNSLRWLYTPHSVGELLYVDNVGLYLLSEEAPSNEVTSINIESDDLELNVGDTQKLTFTINPEDADPTTYTWTTSNENVVTVDNDGNVTAVGAGAAEITVTAENGVSDSIVVTVVDNGGPVEPTTPTESNVGLIVTIVVVSVVVAAGIGVGIYFIIRNKKKNK